MNAENKLGDARRSRSRVQQVVVWLRQRFCSHTGYLEDMERLSDSQVTCPCNKCGKVLSAFCGLDLPIKWERKPDNDPDQRPGRQPKT